MIVCGYCDRESRDHEFCDHCNREIASLCEPVGDAPSEFELACRLTIPCSEWANRWPADPLLNLHVQVKERSFRVYGFSEVQWAAWQPRVETRQANRIAVLPELEIISVATGTIVAVESHSQDSYVINSLTMRDKTIDWIEAADGQQIDTRFEQTGRETVA